MKNILHIISSPRGDHSHSIQLGKTLIKHLMPKYPESKIVERNLIKDDLPYLNSRQISASFKSHDERDHTDKKQLQYSNLIVREIKEADILILGAPMYNFGVHATLKAYIDQIVRVGHTFKYTEGGTPIGLLTDKTVYLAISAGGIYSNNKFNPIDEYIINYLTTVFNFMGVNNITPLIIEGTAIPGFKVNYDEVLKEVDEFPTKRHHKYEVENRCAQRKDQ